MIVKNFVIAHVGTPSEDPLVISEQDIEENIAPVDGMDEVVVIDPDNPPVPLNMETLAVECGIFPSKGKARKNGFGGPIPHGLEAWGTKKRWFWVWCTIAPEKEPTIREQFNQTARRIG